MSLSEFDRAVLDEAAPRDSAVTNITIPYTPRDHFRPLHNSTKRFQFSCAHRRAGKTVAQLNQLIRAALQNQRQTPPPRYGYVGPSFSQTKDLVWGYLKHYTGGIPGVLYSETDLRCTLPNGATITLYGGSAAYERMRGLYFDGIVLDEFPLLNPAVFSTVVRPCLADYRGWAIISGTSNGDDHFHELKKRAEKELGIWDIHIIPVTETDALHPDEVIEMTKDMTPEEYAREMLCDFNAPIEGAYYADLMNRMELQGRMTSVPHDPSTGVFTWWDLGMDDEMVVLFVQRAGRELHVIDEIINSGHGLEWYFKRMMGQGDDLEETKLHAHRREYLYSAHVFPPDINVRELGTGKSRFEVAINFLDNVLIAPGHRVEDGIQAVRSTVPLMYWDKTKAAGTISAMRNYRKSKTGQPVHNWASHPADAVRVGSISLAMTLGMVSGSNVKSLTGALRRRVRGVN